MYDFIAELRVQTRTVNTIRVAKALTWSVRYHIPPFETLKMLLPPRLQQWSYVGDCERALSGFDGALMATLRDLECGEPVAEAIENHLWSYLRRDYVRTIVAAERVGALEPAVLAADAALREPEATHHTYWLSLAWIAAVVITVTGVSFFMNIFIFPKYFRMLDWLMDGYWPRVTNFCYGVTGYLPKAGLVVVVLVLVTALAREVLAFRESAWLPIMWLQDFLADIPLVGRTLRNRRRAAVAATLATVIEAGLDLPAAAEVCARATNVGWPFYRIEILTCQLYDGVNLADAWAACGLGRPGDELYLRPAVMREDPAAGLRQVAQAINARAARVEDRIVAWLTRLMYGSAGTLALATLLVAWLPLVEMYKVILESF